MELPSIDDCKVYLGNNLPKEDFVQAFFFNTTGNINIFKRLFTDPMPGYYLTTDSIAVDLLVQLGFHSFELGWRFCQIILAMIKSTLICKPF